MSFPTLQRRDDFLYRGSNGEVARAIMAIAVGPARKVAEVIENGQADVAPAYRDAAVRFFWRAITGQSQQQFIPGDGLHERVGHTLKLPALAGNHMTAFEHVLYEPDAQINSPRTARLLESVSEAPRTAILYAYGMNPDQWLDHGTCEFYGGGPNADSFVAVLPPSNGLSSKTALKYVGNIAGTGSLTGPEAQRRMDRDSEVLLNSAVVPNAIVPLPAFHQGNPAASLDAAANALRNAGVAN